MGKLGQMKQMKDKNILILFSVAFFDRDARRSGPTIHFVGFVTLVQNLL